MSIKDARKLNKMSQRQLASAIGVDFSVISRYEKGVITPPPERLEAMSKVLNVSVDYLISDPILIEKNVVDNDSRINRLNTYLLKYNDLLSVNYIDYVNMAIKNSSGHCELCGKPAPFKDKEGVPYLEVHSLIPLTNGGLPVPKNTVALCPNCHTKIHVLEDPNDLEILANAANKHN